nr:MAG TPA: hypothetical protein [Caudoviricetes sp.]
MKPRMTLNEVLAQMRKRGMAMGQETLSNGIADGTFPFGKVMSTGKAGRRTFLILRAYFERWAKTYLGDEG